MADILKISTPLIDRNQTSQLQNNRPTVDGAVPFNLGDTTKVVAANDPTEILQQNTGFVPNEESPKILADLLKDPSVTVSLIRNIYMLQEVIKLLPVNNSALTQEIQDLFDSLLLSPDQIVPELLHQDQSSTMFKGDFFDLLRGILVQNNADTSSQNIAQTLQMQQRPQLVRPAQTGGEAILPGTSGTLEGTEAPATADSLLAAVVDQADRQTQAQASPQVLKNGYMVQTSSGSNLATDTGMLLKALHAAFSKGDALESVANNLTYLAKALSPSARLSDKLENLVRALRTPDAPRHFNVLKEEILKTMSEIENSVLYTPHMEKIIPLVVYNLSRYNDNEDFLADMLRQFLTNFNDPTLKEDLVLKLEQYVDKYLPFGGSSAVRAAEEESHVMDVLAKIIGKQVDNESLNLISGGNIDKIVHSLLSSPSNFTPLLHFIVPVEYMDIKAFAEMWIDPNPDNANDQPKKGSMADTSHALVVFDVEEMGRFEVELFVEGKRIAMNLLCPPPLVDTFRGIETGIRKAVSATGYSFESINIGQLEHTHSLMEVFTNLTHRRTGIDVKI